MRYGLIGEKLGHSYSKIIHEKLADYTYDLIPLTREEFSPFMEKKDFTAINVTIPYKQEVIPYLDELHPLAKEIGAVNTIVNKSGHYIGYNTDFYGFEYMLTHNHLTILGRKCLILGNGGTAQTVYAVLKHLGASEILVISRTNTNTSEAEVICQTVSYDTCYTTHTDAAVIINTTPLGMFPNMEASPMDLTTFTKCEAVVDVIFNPLKTKLTLQAEALGIKAVTGLEMLVAQAKQAIEYFLDITLEEKVIDEVYQELLERIERS
ncbi:MAG: hypothetical protein K0S01_633 [Herbinix sp.]|nr:hypothetical protein [Herbinix sp.]